MGSQPYSVCRCGGGHLALSYQVSSPTQALHSEQCPCQPTAPNPLPGRGIWTLIFGIADLNEYNENLQSTKYKKLWKQVGPSTLESQVACNVQEMANS